MLKLDVSHVESMMRGHRFRIEAAARNATVIEAVLTAQMISNIQIRGQEPLSVGAPPCLHTDADVRTLIAFSFEPLLCSRRRCRSRSVNHAHAGPNSQLSHFTKCGYPSCLLSWPQVAS